ncbi:hypothetical protein ES705_18329 [subsurface metagenome]
MVRILIKKNIKNDKTKNLLSNQKGIALLTTLIFVFILVTFGVALLTMTGNDIKLSALQRDSTEAFYIAEAGIDKTLWYLNTPEDNGGKGLDWRTNEYQEPYPAVSTDYYQLTVEDTAEQDIIKITSRGVVSDGNKVYGSRKIEVEAKKAISPSPGLVYNYTIVTEGNLTLKGIIVNGDVHSNGNISVIVDLSVIINGVATASGETNDRGSVNYATQMYPKIDFEYYKGLVTDPDNPDNAYDGSGNGKYYGKDTSVVFETPNAELVGINFIEGDVDIKADLDIIDGGAIFATGEITIISKPNICRHQTVGYDNPLAIIAKGDITLGGYLHVEGVIQTEGTLKISSSNSSFNGAVIADIGDLDGGSLPGGINISYNPNLSVENIIGTGIEIYKIISWEEID